MNKIATRAIAIIAAVGSMVSLAACGSDTASNANVPTPKESDGSVTVNFWHSMSGANGQVLDKMINEFNAQSKGKITVKGLYQGKYDEAITKYKSAVQSQSTPTLMQIYDIGSRFMMDSGTITPMQNFIDKDKYDTSDLQPNVAGYYTVNGKLYSMPFNTSMPVLYYNKALFE